MRRLRFTRLRRFPEVLGQPSYEDFTPAIVLQSQFYGATVAKPEKFRAADNFRGVACNRIPILFRHHFHAEQFSLVEIAE